MDENNEYYTTTYSSEIFDKPVEKKKSKYSFLINILLCHPLFLQHSKV